MAVSCKIKVVKIAAGMAFERYLNTELPRNSRKLPYLRIFSIFFPARNYDAMATQAAMFAGFAFEQITEPVPASTPFLLEASKEVNECIQS